MPTVVPLIPTVPTEELKLEKVDSNISTGSKGQVALSGSNKLSLGFYNLNSDFALP